MPTPTLILAVALSASASWAGVPTKRPADAEKGRTLYEAHCWACHGPEGRGDGPLALATGMKLADLRGSSPDLWPSLVDQIQHGAGTMPAFAEVMDRHDSRRILVWLQALDKDEVPDSLQPTRGQAPADPADSGEPSQDETGAPADSPGDAE